MFLPLHRWINRFSMVSIQKTSSRLRASNHAQIEGFSPSQNYQIKISLFRVITGLNSHKTVCKCSRCATQSRTFSNQYWEFFLVFLQQLSTKARGLPKLWQRNALNLFHQTGTELSVSCFHLYFCQQKLIWSWRKNTAKRIWLASLALAVAKQTSHS